MKKTIFSIGLFLTLLLSGCVQRGNENPKTASKTPPVQNSSFTQSGANTVSPIAVKPADWSSIQGKIKGMYPVGGRKVLVFADQIILYDLATGRNIATAENKGLELIRVWTLDDGYAVVGIFSSQSMGSGMISDSKSPQIYAFFYDTNLKFTSEFNISSLLSDEDFLMDTAAVAISSDGSRIAYATMNGLYLYDRKQDKSKALIDLRSEDLESRLGISFIEQVGYINDGKSVAFKAQSFDVPAVTDKPSFGTIGMINTDGSELTNQKLGGYDAYEITIYDSLLLITENFTASTGRIMVSDNKTGEQKLYNFANKKEGNGMIYGSDTGRYFASSVLNKTGWTVRVYDMETGKLVKEKSISNDGQELYSSNDPMLCVLDGARTCIVILGNKQEAVDTKIASFSF